MQELPKGGPVPASRILCLLRPIFYHPLFWAAIASGMLGMNYLPDRFIDPFPGNKSLMLNGQQKKQVKIETFDRGVAQKFTSVDNLYLYLTTQVADTNDKYQILKEAAYVLRKRFFHAYSVYKLKENWIAVVAGKFIWHDLSAKVLPDDILKGNVAACSQVSIIFMKLCEQFHIPYRKVALNGHYTLEAYCNKKWYYFDLDLKPDFSTINGRKSLTSILNAGEQYRLYANTFLDSVGIAFIFSSVKFGIPNDDPATNAAFFHRVTKIVSHWGWLLPLAIMLQLMFYRRTQRNISTVLGPFRGNIRSALNRI